MGEKERLGRRKSRKGREERIGRRGRKEEERTEEYSIRYSI